VAALIGTSEGRLRLSQSALAAEQTAELKCTVGTAGNVRAPICLLRTRDIARLLEPKSHL
jgi:hypothetical protein